MLAQTTVLNNFVVVFGLLHSRSFVLRSFAPVGGKKTLLFTCQSFSAFAVFGYSRTHGARVLSQHIITSKQFLAVFIILALLQPVHGAESPD